MTNHTLQCGARTLDLSAPVVMGVLNVTPDSFSDGGRYADRDAALRHAQAMIAAGAKIIDIGGESSRPGAASVSVAEELDRVIPVLEVIAAECDVVISIDSSTAAVMTAAASAGAGIINDIRALRDRKSTRLNSSHVRISYAVFCLKKKNGMSGAGSRAAAAGRDGRGVHPESTPCRSRVGS